MGTITRLIRSLFGLSSDGRDTETGSESRESEITIEREPETASEDAVKGTETASGAETAVSEPESGSEASAPADTPESTGETETETADSEPEPEDEPGAPVDEINGIGPTYSGRLDEAGIGTVPELAGSDPATVADAAQVSESRASNWIEQAENFA